MHLPKKQRPKTWTYKEWYADNKDFLNKKRRDRYEKDTEYCEKIKKASRDSRAKAAKNKPVDPNHQPKKRGFAKPKIIQVDDTQWPLENVSALLRETGIHRITFNRWNELGVLPRYSWEDEHGRHWYPRPFLDYLNKLLEKRVDEKTVGGQAYWLGNFRQEAALLWARVRKKMPDLSRAQLVN